MVLILTSKKKAISQIKAICVAFIFITLISCNKNKETITLKYNNNNILINYRGNEEYLRIPFKSIEKIKDSIPVYYIDSIKKTIFIYVPSFGIKNFDLSNKKLINERFLEYKYHKRNHSFKLFILNHNVVLSSYLQVLVFNENLELKADLRDTIERNLCPMLALHKYEIEFKGDTLLFKALFVKTSDFKSNNRYKSIYKDYEFILKDSNIRCNNCDKPIHRSPEDASL